MAIKFTEEETELLYKNGFSDDDIQYTIDEDRKNGLSDDKIQTNFNNVINKYAQENIENYQNAYKNTSGQGWSDIRHQITQDKSLTLDKKKQLQQEITDYSNKQNNKDFWKYTRKNLTQGALGQGLMAGSMHPIFNVPYVGTGIGGALYGMGDAIVNDKKGGDIFKDTVDGFIIGETVGAVPYVGKTIGKTPVGKAVANKVKQKAAQIAKSKGGQVVSDIANSQAVKKLQNKLAQEVKNVPEWLNYASSAESPLATPVRKIVSAPGDLLNWAGRSFANKVARLEPETIKQLTKPGSKALDMSKDEADRLALETTERFRDAYNTLKRQKGEKVGNEAKKLKNQNSRIFVNDLKNDITSTFDQYQGDFINPARNMTGNLEEDLLNLTEQAPKQFSSQIKLSNLVKQNPNQIVEPFIITERNLRNNGEIKGINKDIENTIFSKINKQTVFKNVYDNEKANLSKRSLSKMINTATENSKNQIKELGIPKEYQQQLFDDSREIVSHIKELYSNAIPILEHPDTKGIVKSIKRYAIPVEMNGNKYNVMMTVKNNELDEIGILHNLQTNKNILGGPANAPQSGSFQHQGYNTSITDLVDFVNSNIKKYKETISPNDLNSIKKEIGSLVNWSDETARNYKNPILEQIYGKYNNRLSNLSEGLANANKEYSDLQNLLGERSRLKTILNPKSDIETATSKLKNYKTINDNIYDLENRLVNELGEQPFLTNIDDVNAALDLLSVEKTGDSLLANVSKLATRPALRIKRWYNGTPLAQRLQRPLGNGERNLLERGLVPVAVEEIPLLLQGGVEMNVPYEKSLNY